MKPDLFCMARSGLQEPWIKVRTLYFQVWTILTELSHNKNKGIKLHADVCIQ